MHISLFPYHYAFISPSVLSQPLSRPQIEPNQSHLIKQMPEARINTGFRHFNPLFKLGSREINYNDFNSVFATFHRFIRHIFCPDFDWYKNCTQIVLTPTQQNLFFDQRHIDQFLQFFLQHRFIRQL